MNKKQQIMELVNDYHKALHNAYSAKNALRTARENLEAGKEYTGLIEGLALEFYAANKATKTAYEAIEDAL